MFTMYTAAPSAVATSGILLAVTIAVAATTLVALGSVMWSLQRSARLNRLRAGIGATTALVILVGSAVIGGSLTRPPVTFADEDRAPRTVARDPSELQPSESKTHVKKLGVTKLSVTKLGVTKLGVTKLSVTKPGGFQLPTI